MNVPRFVSILTLTADSPLVKWLIANGVNRNWRSLKRISKHRSEAPNRRGALSTKISNHFQVRIYSERIPKAAAPLDFIDTRTIH